MLAGSDYVNGKELSFDDKIERLFKKIGTNAMRHKNNFKHTNYELSQQVTAFMEERANRKKGKKGSSLQNGIMLEDSSDNEPADPEERLIFNQRKQAEAE